MVDVIPVSRVNYLFRDATTFEWITHNPRMDELLEKELDRDTPDLVHVHHLTCLSTTILERVRERGIPLVMTLHDFWTVCLRGQRITPKLEICHGLDRGLCAPCLERLWPHYKISQQELEALDASIRSRLQGCDRLISPSAFHFSICK